jgi:hypothetical protein
MIDAATGMTVPRNATTGLAFTQSTIFLNNPGLAGGDGGGVSAMSGNPSEKIRLDSNRLRAGKM